MMRSEFAANDDRKQKKTKQATTAPKGAMAVFIVKFRCQAASTAMKRMPPLAMACLRYPCQHRRDNPAADALKSANAPQRSNDRRPWVKQLVADRFPVEEGNNDLQRSH